MQVKNAVSASLMRQSYVLSGAFLLMKSTIWYAVCKGNYSEFQLNPYLAIRQVKQRIPTSRRSRETGRTGYCLCPLIGAQKALGAFSRPYIKKSSIGFRRSPIFGVYAYELLEPFGISCKFHEP